MEKCWVCEGGTPRSIFGYRCEKHNVCDVCKKPRKEINGIPWGTKTGFICEECRQKQNQEKIDTWSKEDHDDYVYRNNHEIVCPYCGYKHYPDDTYESVDEYECPNCDSIMWVEIEYTPSFSTGKPKV